MSELVVYSCIGNEATHHVEVMVRNETGVIEHEDREYRFMPLSRRDIENTRRQMVDRGYRYCPCREIQVRHELVWYSEAGEEVIVSAMLPNPMFDTAVSR